ncbi:hypothetical protein FGO68_gene12164 [Halteria grandinella]|uniref:Uncharacterized protein n=1 Tax=Halteria grandinella TaxID=5974 RepID=A0A8J8NWB9_HALGN|nr:hypothetical protein FGO68_gene12164 [Halteria grandinella]
MKSAPKSKVGLTDALTHKKSLEAKLEAQRNSSVLSLNDCCIGDDGCHILATFLTKYTGITDIELRGNSIGGEGIIALSSVIRQSMSLRSISLEWNNLGGAGDQALTKFFDAIAENRSLLKLDLKNNEIGPEVAPHIERMLKNNQSLECLDLRWNKLSNEGAKLILKGLNLNKYLSILELGGNRVSDERLRQLNELLTRNKNKEPMALQREASPATRKQTVQLGAQFGSGQFAPISIGGNFLSPKNKGENNYDFEYERDKIEEKHLDLARELEEETRKRCEVEDQLERIRDEYYKKDLEDSKLRSELQARIEQLESEKQHLQLKIVRLSDTHDQGDLKSKEKQQTYEAMLQESKRAYVQLDETYKGLIEKAIAEKATALKQCEKSYQIKIKNLEETVRQLRTLSEDQKRQIDILEGQKIDLKMEFDNQLFNLQRQYTQDQSKQEEIRLKQLETAIEKISRERDETYSRLKQDAQSAAEKYKQLSDSLVKMDDRMHQTHERSQHLEKENASLRAQLQKIQSEFHQTEQTSERHEQQAKELARTIAQGKDTDAATLDRLTQDIKRERKEQERSLQDAYDKVRDLERQVAKLKGESVDKQDLFSGQEKEIKERLTGAISALFKQLN